MDEYKKAMQAVDVPSIIAMGDFVAPALLSMGVRAVMQAGQLWCQAVTTNVPGPNFPLYVLGKKMQSAHAYVPIAGGTRISIGIFSYLGTMTFGINADFDAFADVDVLSDGIRRGIDELLALAAQESAPAPTPKAAAKPADKPADPAPVKKAATASAPVKKAATATAPAKKATAATAAPAKKATADTPAPAKTAAAAKKAPAKKAPAKKAPAKKAPAKKAPGKKAPATSTAGNSSPAKSSPAKSTPAKSSPGTSTAPPSAPADATPAAAGAR
jgi:hypothetical protein